VCSTAKRVLQENYFHAVFEATKSIAAKIRSLTDHPGDGAPLVQATFGGANPAIAINSLKTDSERSEQSGFANLPLVSSARFAIPCA